MTVGSRLSHAISAFAGAFLLVVAVATVGPAQAQSQARKPNILVIMGDDVGWFNIGAYHQGITPVMKFARPAVQLASA
jgi:hypothetical protein